MRITPGTENWTISSLKELDALVGEIVMQDHPSIHWEDAAARFRFDSLDEALDVMHDSILQDYLSGGRCEAPLLKVREFRTYSTTLEAAWEVVDRLSPEPFQLRKEGREWAAAFGDNPAVRGASAEQAICLAALRSIGCEVRFDIAKGSSR